MIGESRAHRDRMNDDTRSRHSDRMINESPSHYYDNNFEDSYRQSRGLGEYPRFRSDENPALRDYYDEREEIYIRRPDGPFEPQFEKESRVSEYEYQRLDRRNDDIAMRDRRSMGGDHIRHKRIEESREQSYVYEEDYRREMAQSLPRNYRHDDYEDRFRDSKYLRSSIHSTESLGRSARDEYDGPTQRYSEMQRSYDFDLPLTSDSRHHPISQNFYKRAEQHIRSSDHDEYLYRGPPPQPHSRTEIQRAPTSIKPSPDNIPRTRLANMSHFANDNNGTYNNIYSEPLVNDEDVYNPWEAASEVPESEVPPTEVALEDSDTSGIETPSPIDDVEVLDNSTPFPRYSKWPEQEEKRKPGLSHWDKNGTMLENSSALYGKKNKVKLGKKPSTVANVDKSKIKSPPKKIVVDNKENKPVKPFVILEPSKSDSDNAEKSLEKENVIESIPASSETSKNNPNPAKPQTTQPKIILSLTKDDFEATKKLRELEKITKMQQLQIKQLEKQIQDKQLPISAPEPDSRWPGRPCFNETSGPLPLNSASTVVSKKYSKTQWPDLGDSLPQKRLIIPISSSTSQPVKPQKNRVLVIKQPSVSNNIAQSVQSSVSGSTKPAPAPAPKKNNFDKRPEVASANKGIANAWIKPPVIEAEPLPQPKVKVIPPPPKTVDDWDYYNEN
ncbi:hypothetical protein HK096_010701, partial [Nowakowskiella sp. JEL0078]